MTNFNELLKEKMEARIDILKEMKEERMLGLLENDAYVNMKTKIAVRAKDNEVLIEVLDMLNTITPMVTREGVEYRVRIFPSAPGVFGDIRSKLLAVVIGVQSAFTAEMEAEYGAFTRVETVLLKEASEAFGNTPYCNSEGIIINDVKSVWDVNSINLLLSDISQQLELIGEYVITETELNKWWDSTHRKAEARKVALEKAAQLGEAQFTLN